HGQAVAYAGGQLGLRSRVYMPAATPANYVHATRGYGAEVVLPESIHTAFEKAQADEQAGWVFVHPFDDVEVIAGQGTLGLEILQDLPAATDVVVSFGGGGMATGVATAIKSLKSDVRIWGVETEGADCMSQALAAGHLVRLEAITSIARTLGAPSASELTLAAAHRFYQSVEVVSDAATLEALIFLLERAKVLTEPAAACTWAAAQRLRDRFTPASKVVLVLCGGNFSVADLCRLRT
ncbi:MAG: threonine ammonia-lyase, partial [Terriglobales bacterium]